MADVIRHLRGNSETWRNHDGIVRDGELALLMAEDGRYRVKIGDGKTRFSALPYIDGRILRQEGESCSVTLATGLDIRAGALSVLSLSLPDPIPEDLYCVISFDSANSPTTVEYLFEGALFSGDSVNDGVLAPEANTHYTLMLWYDGRLHCHSRGVAYE